MKNTNWNKRRKYINRAVSCSMAIMLHVDNNDILNTKFLDSKQTAYSSALSKASLFSIRIENRSIQLF